MDEHDGIRVGRSTLRLVSGDITDAHVHAIVNAANEHLAGGSGVDGAIHAAGGPSILAECRKIGRCATGDAVWTGAGRLEARHVIHTVAPRWRGGSHGEQDLLRSAYVRSLQVAEQLGDHSVAFPSLGTGVYGNPLESSARLAIQSVMDYLRGETEIADVQFYLLGPAFGIFRRTLAEVAELAEG